MAAISNTGDGSFMISIGDDDDSATNATTTQHRGYAPPSVSDVLPMPATASAGQYISPTHSSPYSNTTMTPTQPTAPPSLYSPGTASVPSVGSYSSTMSMGAVPPAPPVTSGAVGVETSAGPARGTSAASISGKPRLSLGRTGSISQRLGPGALPSPHVMIPASPNASPQVAPSQYPFPPQPPITQSSTTVQSHLPPPAPSSPYTTTTSSSTQQQQQQLYVNTNSPLHSPYTVPPSVAPTTSPTKQHFTIDHPSSPTPSNYPNARQLERKKQVFLQQSRGGKERVLAGVKGDILGEGSGGGGGGQVQGGVREREREVARGFRRIPPGTWAEECKKLVGPPNGHVGPTKRATTYLLRTFTMCNPAYNYQSTNNPRRVLTKPSKPTHNDGYDNEEWDYILYVNDILGPQEGRQYQIMDVLGQGTFGQVVKCVNLKTKETVAVKVIKNKPAYYNQSLVEVAILDLLNNEHDPHDKHHIVRLRDTFVFRHHLCLVFEMLSVNLYELIKQNQFRGLSTNLVRVFVSQILDALGVLGRGRIIHCDLKPEVGGVGGVFLGLDSPSIKVIDYGSACHENQTVYTYIQSRFYRSPEVLLGLPYTSSIDMWSLGCIAAELFLGLPLFPGSSEYNQVARIVEMLGVPPSYMCEKGKAAHQFFDKHLQHDGKVVWRLKSMETYMREQGTTEQPSKRYFSGTTLPEIVNQYPVVRKGLTSKDVDKEMQNRLAFIDFLEGLLNLNPLERWSPQQAKAHPFVTGEKFTGRFVPPGRGSRPQTPSAQVSSSEPIAASAEAGGRDHQSDTPTETRTNTPGSSASRTLSQSGARPRAQTIGGTSGFESVPPQLQRIVDMQKERAAEGAASPVGKKTPRFATPGTEKDVDSMSISEMSRGTPEVRDSRTPGGDVVMRPESGSEDRGGGDDGEERDMGYGTNVASSAASTSDGAYVSAQQSTIVRETFGGMNIEHGGVPGGARGGGQASMGHGMGYETGSYASAGQTAHAYHDVPQDRNPYDDMSHQAYDAMAHPPQHLSHASHDDPSMSPSSSSSIPFPLRKARSQHISFSNAPPSVTYGTTGMYGHGIGATHGGSGTSRSGGGGYLPVGLLASQSHRLTRTQSMALQAAAEAELASRGESHPRYGSKGEREGELPSRRPSMVDSVEWVPFED
ncbi:dual specificity protein kinase yak1, partial [Rhizophlyctis rosea]